VSQAFRVCAAIVSHPANRGRQWRALFDGVRWQIRKRVNPTPYILPYHGVELTCYPDSEQSSAAIYFHGMPDYWEMSFAKAYLRSGDAALDIGANIGVYSLLFASLVGRDGIVHAFEANEHSAKRLAAQLEHNNLANITIHRKAVSNTTGKAYFGFAESSATQHLARLDESAEKGNAVDCIALDDFEPWQSFALVKIDIEGAEPLAIEGAKKRLSEMPPKVILLELAGYSKGYGYESETVIEMLESYGYDIAIFDPDTRSLRDTREPWTLGVTNVLAIQRSCRDEVEARIAANVARSQ
jgi:FkbM family methyltransferase